MKKLFTFLLVALLVVAARATDYNVPITIIENGVSYDQTGVITIFENDGLYDFTLKNFVLQVEDGPMGVGNVELKGITPCQDGDATLLLTNDTVTITSGDDPNVAFWMATTLSPVPVNLRAKIEGERLRCYLDINMMESMGQLIQVAIGDGYQLPNASFEAWHSSTDSYVEPNGWHSFESATGEMAAMAGHHIAKSSDAHSGLASARIFATSIFGIVANGTMTTGRMNAGSMIATDTQNHAYLDMSMTDLDGNGDPFYVPLRSRPDSIAVWVKFKQGTVNSAHPYATISAVITDGSYYQDPEDTEYTNVVAKAKDDKIATTDGQWVRVVAPFVYTDNAVSPQAVLVTISTNADAGQGSANDEVLVDDIQFIYNAKVSGIKIKGEEVPGFTPEKTDYEMELNEEITADDIEVITDGKAANISKTVTVEDGMFVCTIVALGADMSAMSSYVVKVGNSLTAYRSETVTAFSSPSFTVTLDPNGGTAQYINNSYYRLGGGGRLTLRGKSNVDRIISVKMNYQEAERTGNDVAVSAGTLMGDSITGVNDSILTITANGSWPQLWLSSLEVTYEGTAPVGTYAVRLPQYLSHGTVTSDRDWADEGDIVTLTATAEGDYQLSRLYANRGAVTITASATAADQYTFTMPAEDVTVGAVFAEGITMGVLLNRPEDSVADKHDKMPVYNLQGQRVTQMCKGIYITGGRKQVVR